MLARRGICIEIYPLTLMVTEDLQAGRQSCQI